jgi:hypothetical protein
VNRWLIAPLAALVYMAAAIAAPNPAGALDVVPTIVGYQPHDCLRAGWWDFRMVAHLATPG